MGAGVLGDAYCTVAANKTVTLRTNEHIEAPAQETLGESYVRKLSSGKWRVYPAASFAIMSGVILLHFASSLMMSFLIHALYEYLDSSAWLAASA